MRPRNPNGLGAWLRDLRLAAGRTQQDVADAAGITNSSLSRFESGEIRPTYRTAVRLADALNVSINELDAAFRAPTEGTHPVVNVLIDAGMDQEDALGIESRLPRALRDSLYAVLADGGIRRNGSAS